jgi:hypothetical protein
MAAQRLATKASDPSVDGALLAWHVAGQAGVLVQDGQQTRLGGAHPALGQGRVAVTTGSTIEVQSTAGDGFGMSIPAPGADAVAVSRSWVAWRVREGDGDVIYAVPLGAGGAPREVMRAPELGRPALQGDRLAFHLIGRTSRIIVADLSTGRAATARQERRALLLNPSLQGRRLLYVRAYYARQELRLGPVTRRAPRKDRRLWSTVPTARRDAGHEPGNEHKRHGHPHKLWRRPRQGVSSTLWTTALAEDAAYVTRLRQVSGQPLVAEIVRVSR